MTLDGDDNYIGHLDRMAVPMLFISGEENACYFPESTERTYEALRTANDADLYDRKVIPNYGHIDCIFGKSASEDVFPHIADHLNNTA